MALQVATTFKDDRCRGLTIVWQLGSGELKLARIGGPNGSSVIDTRRHHTYKQSAGAVRGAERWFNLLANVFENDTADELADA